MPLWGRVAFVHCANQKRHRQLPMFMPRCRGVSLFRKHHRYRKGSVPVTSQDTGTGKGSTMAGTDDTTAVGIVSISLQYSTFIASAEDEDGGGGDACMAHCTVISDGWWPMARCTCSGVVGCPVVVGVAVSVKVRREDEPSSCLRTSSVCTVQYVQPQPFALSLASLQTFLVCFSTT